LVIRTGFVVVVSLALASSAWADVTITQTTTGKGLALSGTLPGTTYIKGMKMRSDSVVGDTTRTVIFDLEAQKMYSFDSKKKEVDVWDMQTFAAEMSKAVSTSDVKATLSPNTQTKQIAGRTADGYDLDVTMPTAIGGNKDMTMTVQLQGPVWIVKDSPGAEDYVRFYKAAVERGWIFSDPRAAKGLPGQAKSLSEMYRQMAETGGMAYETDIEIKMGGGGPFGSVMGRLGNMSAKTTVQSVETGPLDDSLFAPPPGYKPKEQK
jgi:hypothetical protein